MSLLTGLVSFWELNGDALDSHGTNNGTASGVTYGPAWIDNGAFGTGVLGYINAGVGTAGDLNITGDMTVAAWIYSNGGAGFIVTRCDANGGTLNTYEFRMQGTQLQFLIYSGQPICAGGTLQPFVWTHVVGTRIGTALKVYMDGGLVGSATLTGAPSSLPGHNTLLGTRQDGNSYLGVNNFALNQVGIWNVGLTSEEVRDLWSVQAPGYPLTPTAYNPFFTQTGFDAEDCWFDIPFDDIFVGLTDLQPAGWCSELDFPSRGSVTEGIFSAIGGVAFTPDSGTIATLSEFVPAEGSPITRRGTVQFKAETSVGGQAIIWASFTDGNGKSSEELVFDGVDFTDRYIASTVATTAPDTYLFILRRTNGWYATPSITARGSGV